MNDFPFYFKLKQRLDWVLPNLPEYWVGQQPRLLRCIVQVVQIFHPTDCLPSKIVARYSLNVDYQRKMSIPERSFLLH